MSDSSRASGDRHSWFRERITLYLSGLLDESDETAFLGHAADCARGTGDIASAQDDKPLTGAA